MAFKIPLPKLTKSHEHNSSVNQSVLSLGLPSFQQKEFTLISLIGQGSFGNVYRCVKNDITYVIKQLVDDDADELQLLIKEARLLKLLHGHENIVTVHGFSSLEKAILLEYVSFSFACLGVDRDSVSNLKELLESCDSISSFSGFDHMQFYIAIDIATGLQYLHSNGVVHRDLKPANVLVSNNHYVACSASVVNNCWSVRPVVAKLTDFGESRSSVI